MLIVKLNMTVLINLLIIRFQFNEFFAICDSILFCDRLNCSACELFFGSASLFPIPSANSFSSWFTTPIGSNFKNKFTIKLIEPMAIHINHCYIVSPKSMNTPKASPPKVTRMICRTKMTPTMMMNRLFLVMPSKMFF